MQAKIYVTRYVFAILVANQFRRPSIAQVGMGMIFVLNEIHHLGDHSLPRVKVAFSQRLRNDQDDFFMWLLTVLPAMFTMLYIHTKPRKAKWIFRGICAVTLISMTQDQDAFFLALPFLQMGHRLISFAIVIIVSYIDHYRLQIIAREVWEQYQVSGIPGSIKLLRKVVMHRSGLTDHEIKIRIEEEQTKVTADFQSAALETIRADDNAGKECIQYEKLSGDYIRLLKAVRPNIAGNDTLEFQISYHALSDVTGRYTALSYCWGPARHESIIVDGKPVRASVNLCQALRELLPTDKKLIWVDAICINQDDIEERNKQVLRMLPIFQEAKEVVAWIGSPDEASKRVMACLESMSSDIQIYGSEGSHSLEDLNQFMGRHFWRRIWIIQELAVANQVHIVCCNKRASLEQLGAMLEMNKQAQSIDQQQWPTFLERRQLIENILNIRRRRSERPYSLSLLESLVMTKASRSTENHDRVYGLLGLVTDRTDFLTEPNYHLDIARLCRDMTKSFIRGRKSLDIILVAPRPVLGKDLPSWCPNYFNAAGFPFNTKLVKYLSGQDIRYRLGKKESLWATTNGSTAWDQKTYRFSDDGLTLSVRGFLIGVVNAVGSVPNDNNRGFQRIRRVTTFSSSQSSLQMTSKSVVAAHEALRRILLLYVENYEEMVNMPKILQMVFHDWNKYYAATTGEHAEEVEKWRNENAAFLIEGESLQNIAQNTPNTASWSLGKLLTSFPKALDASKSLASYPQVIEALGTLVREEMPLIITRDGSLGWGHPEAFLRDEIFLFAGCSMPVILRPCTDGKGYHVIGHAYLDGYMDGSKWNATPDSEHKWINIC